MRIAHFYGHESANGVTWSIMDVSRLLVERGHHVQIFCRMDSALMAYPHHTTYLWLGKWHYPWLRAKLRRFLVQERIDVLNVHSQRDADIALQIAREVGVPTCYSCRELSETACNFAPLADRTIAVSVGVGRFVEARYAIHPPALHVIPNGIDTTTLPCADRATLRAESGFRDGEVWIGYLGRIAKNKNVDGLLRGFACVAPHAPALRLVVMGDGKRLSRMRELAKTLQIADRVRFTGWLPRYAAFRLVGGLDALALISHAAEGLSNALLAAMAMGVPVLASDIPSLAGGPLCDEETGWLCAPNDDSIAEGLVRIMADSDDYRRQLGTAAQREVAQHHRMEDVVTRLEAAYRDAIAARAGLTVDEPVPMEQAA
ncbi:MAG: glycosyltransferase family 4 protein [Armatimonadota bacterium]